MYCHTVDSLKLRAREATTVRELVLKKSPSVELAGPWTPEVWALKLGESRKISDICRLAAPTVVLPVIDKHITQFEKALSESEESRLYLFGERIKKELSSPTCSTAPTCPPPPPPLPPPPPPSPPNDDDDDDYFNLTMKLLRQLRCWAQETVSSRKNLAEDILIGLGQFLMIAKIARYLPAAVEQLLDSLGRCVSAVASNLPALLAQTAEMINMCASVLQSYGLGGQIFLLGAVLVFAVCVLRNADPTIVGASIISVASVGVMGCGMLLGAPLFAASGLGAGAGIGAYYLWTKFMR